MCNQNIPLFISMKWTYISQVYSINMNKLYWFHLEWSKAVTESTNQVNEYMYTEFQDVVGFCLDSIIFLHIMYNTCTYSG